MINQQANLTCQTVIAGGGIAGLVCALELLQNDQTVIVVDRDTPERLGGLARWAFGGMALSGTKEQKRAKIPDNASLLLKDWHRFAEFSEQDKWPKVWSEIYAERNHELVYQWLRCLGFKFLPAVNWVERGLYTPGNSVPRYHILWGTGWELVERIISLLTPYVEQGKLTILHQHKVIKPYLDACNVHNVVVENEKTQQQFSISASNIVVACGGINGSAEQVKQNCLTGNALIPDEFLNGANPVSDGILHQAVAALGGIISHEDKMWNYAAGVHHPLPEFDGHGLSLIPCKSALWLDHTGKRIGPDPLVTGFDTHYLCQQVARQEKPWTWQLLNWDIAIKELAVSGSLHNPSIKNKKILGLMKEVLFGNRRLVNQLLDECEDVICADSLTELVNKMNQHTHNHYIDIGYLTDQVMDYDSRITSGQALYNDDQVRRIQHARQWQPDKLRTCKPAPILKTNSKLIAIKLQLITRKSLGGLQTNQHCQVLNRQDSALDGLYCIGEAAGFGGGGACGKRSLEGTFLSGCILTARIAAQHITNKTSRES